MSALGVYPRWETEAQIFSAMERDWLHFKDNFWEPRWRNLEAYARGDNPFSDQIGLNLERKFSFNVSMSLDCAMQEQGSAMKLMFAPERKSGWGVLLAKSWGYDYWRTRIDHYHRVDSLCTDYRVSMRSAVNVLSACLCAGWVEQAKLLAKEIGILCEGKRFYDCEYYPIYHTFLRVCFDHWGFSFELGEVFDGEKGNLLSEPRMGELVDHWRDENLSAMQEHILWMCDCYTHRTRRKSWYEFSDSHLLTRFPAVILAWQRLREIRGLRNFPIDHPLMRPEYARLQPAMPFYTDPVLEAALDRLRFEEMPGLGGDRQLSSPEISQKRSLIERLFG